MNKLSPNGKSVIDATGKSWPLETAHPMPLPDGIVDDITIHFMYWSRSYKKWILSGYDSSHWLLRTEPPAPKTQEELDEETFRRNFNVLDFTKAPDAWGKLQFAHSHVKAMWDGWRAALAYERGRKQP